MDRDIQVPGCAVPSMGRRTMFGAAAALGGAGLLDACALFGPGLPEPAPGTEAIASDPLDTAPGNRAATFRNIDRLAPTRTIRCGDEISATLRDDAPFGPFFLRGGIIRGEAVLPPDGATLQRGHTRRLWHTDKSTTIRWSMATGGGRFRRHSRPCRFTTGRTLRSASSASFFMSTPRKTSWRSSGVRGDRHGSTGPRSRHTQ